MRHISTIVLSLFLFSCGDGDSVDSEELGYSSEAEADELADVEGNPDISDNYDDEEKGGETYSEYDERRDSYDEEYGSFGGYGCTEDCSGHEAGYAWAEEKGITEPEHCGGRSWSFIEGCQAYAEENQE